MTPTEDDGERGPDAASEVRSGPTRPDPQRPDPDQPDPDQDRRDGESALRHQRERRRLAEIFGDVLPESTRDDRDVEGGAETGTDARDADLRRNVPPHHT